MIQSERNWKHHWVDRPVAIDGTRYRLANSGNRSNSAIERHSNRPQFLSPPGNSNFSGSSGKNSKGGGEKTETMIPCNGFSGNEYGSNNAASVEYQVNDALAYRISMLDCFILIHFRYPENLPPRDSSSTWSIKRITLRERF